MVVLDRIHLVGGQWAGLTCYHARLHRIVRMKNPVFNEESTMNSRTTLAGLLAGLVLLVAGLPARGQGMKYNPYTGTWVGGTTTNPYTGTKSRQVYNYNPYTGTKSAGT